MTTGAPSSPGSAVTVNRRARVRSAWRARRSKRRKAAVMPPAFLRSTFEMSLAAEYLTVRELQAMTGQPQQRFVAVVLKELLDNAIDACETAGVAPVLWVGWQAHPAADLVQLTIADNGLGIT